MKPVSLSFLWHMHQPIYRLRGQDICFMPWVRLHAVRAYYDMIRVLDEFPAVRVTMNLVPSMVEQLIDYNEGGRDMFQQIGSLEPDALGEVERTFLFDNFFSAQLDQMIRPIPHYAELFARRQQARLIRAAGDAWKEFSTQDYVDLIALFNLAWFGFKAREDFPSINALLRKGGKFTVTEIREIHEIQSSILRKLIPLYREKLERKQIEISTTPYAHPILPLITNNESARESMPKHPLPPLFRYPQDARRQVSDGLDLIEKVFGKRPIGIWPSEGSLSQEVVEMLAAAGLQWTATDEGNLHRSDRDAPPNHHHLWETTTPTGALKLVFRDRELSDRIGFTYQTRDPREAARDFVDTILAKCAPDREHKDFVLVALDGENPWEHYPFAGALFLRALYSEITQRKEVTAVPVGELIASTGTKKKLRHVHAGSWINTDFGIWIGGPEKNQAWSILGRVREELSADLDAPAADDPRRIDAWKSIRAAEGSDWFWWLDGQFTNSYREQFDETFRNHLQQAYEALDLPVPNFLEWFIPSTRVLSEGVHGEPFEWLAPAVDGFESDLFEWHGAIRLPWKSLSIGSQLRRPLKPFSILWIGFSCDQKLYLRIDPEKLGDGSPFQGMRIEMSFNCAGRVRKIRVQLDPKGDLSEATAIDGLPEGNGSVEPAGLRSESRAVARKILEISVPCREAGLTPDQPAVMILNLESASVDVQVREIRIKLPSDHSMIDSAGVE
ncbi:MAG: glycoside hydrolase family 57 protein [Pseudomonadota bacterium]